MGRYRMRYRSFPSVRLDGCWEMSTSRVQALPQKHLYRKRDAPRRPVTNTRCGLLLEMQPLELLAGHRGDEVEVPVVVENREAGQLGGRRDQQVGYRRRAVVSAIGEQLLDLDGAVLDGWRQVLNGHGGQWWSPQTRPQLISGTGAEPDLQPGDGAHTHDAPFDPLGPRLPIRGVTETDHGGLVDEFGDPEVMRGAWE